MIVLLLRLYPAHLHLRGLGAASDHRKGFAMSLRVGGYAAILGGLLWLYVLVGDAINDGAGSGAPFIMIAVAIATVMTLVALVGLSAFQSRQHPLLIWAAFAIPATGAVVVLGLLAMIAVGDADRVVVGGLDVSAWAISSVGVMTLVLGSALFALATWRARSLSRGAAALLGVGALLVMPAIAGVTGGLLPPVLAGALLITILAFPAGWIALGVSALRVGSPQPAATAGPA